MTRAFNCAAALVAFGAFLYLGAYVTTYGEPARLLPIEDALRGKSQLVAWWFTWLGYAYILAPLMIATLIVGFVKREWLVRTIVPIVVTVVAWQLADFCQRHFRRLRPPTWYVKHETAFSFPSSHAAIAVAFYLLWAVILWRSDLPQRTRNIVALTGVFLAAGILWSRLALGAHYITDVTGGALLSAGVVCLALGLLAAFGISLWPHGARPLKVRTEAELP